MEKNNQEASTAVIEAEKLHKLEKFCFEQAECLSELVEIVNKNGVIEKGRPISSWDAYIEASKAISQLITTALKIRKERQVQILLRP